jgi:hypothetical protein
MMGALDFVSRELVVETSRDLAQRLVVLRPGSTTASAPRPVFPVWPLRGAAPRPRPALRGRGAPAIVCRRVVSPVAEACVGSRNCAINDCDQYSSPD